MCGSAQVTFCTDDATKVAAKDGGSDASTRSTPALENAAARTAIAASLADLNSALAGGNITKAREALNSARAALAGARAQVASFGGDAADLGSIELLLDHIDRVTG
jgi:ABC-type transporter Mla subunit MlaD